MGRCRRRVMDGRFATSSITSSPATCGPRELGSGRTIADVGSASRRRRAWDPTLSPRTTRRPSQRRRCSRRPVRSTRRAPSRTGRCPGAVYAGHRFIDVLIHGWDRGVGDRPTHRSRSATRRCVLGGACDRSCRCCRPAERSASKPRASRQRSADEPAGRARSPSLIEQARSSRPTPS